MTSLGHSKVKRLFGGSVWMLGDRLFRLAISFGIGVVVARHFGPNEFGQISYVVATAAVFGSLSSVGLDDIIPRDLAAKDRSEISIDDMQYTALVLRVCGGFLAYGLLLLVVWWEQGWSMLFLLAVVIGLYFPLQATDIYEYRLRVDGHFSAIARVRTFAGLISAALKGIVVWLALPIAFLAVAMTAEFGLSAIGLNRALSMALNRRSEKRFRSAYASQLLKQSWKVILAGVLVMLQFRLEYFLIEKFLGWDQVGQYAAILKLVELFDVAIVIFVTMLLPELARDKKLLNNCTFQRAYLVGVLMYLSFLPLILITYFAFPYLYGNQYAEVAGLMLILALRPFFIMVIAVRGMFIVVNDKFWYAPTCSITGVLCGLITGIFFIPEFGLKGAAISAMIGLFCSTVLIDAILYKESFYALVGCWRQSGYVLKKIREVFQQ